MPRLGKDSVPQRGQVVGCSELVHILGLPAILFLETERDNGWRFGVGQLDADFLNLPASFRFRRHLEMLPFLVFGPVATDFQLAPCIIICGHSATLLSDAIRSILEKSISDLKGKKVVARQIIIRSNKPSAHQSATLPDK